jgi:Na+/glutamate symporter
MLEFKQWGSEIYTKYIYTQLFPELTIPELVVYGLITEIIGMLTFCLPQLHLQLPFLELSFLLHQSSRLALILHPCK